MTIITVTAPHGRLALEQKRQLAQGLTDAVLVPEIGREDPTARVGFQVHFVDLEADQMAIGGKLLIDHEKPRDVMTIDVCAMDGYWPREVRAAVITRVLACLTEVCKLPKPSATWWVNFRTIDEGSWGSRGRVLSILDLLETGAFSTERADAIRRAIG